MFTIRHDKLASQKSTSPFRNDARLWHLIVAILAVVTWHESTTTIRADQNDRRQIDELVQQQRFDEAEQYCERQLSNSRLNVVQQAELVRSLIRVYSEHARYVPAKERQNIWQKSSQLHDSFVAEHNSNPQSLLVRLQFAMSLLARGEIAFEEFARWKRPGEANQEAISSLTETARQLESLQRDVTAVVRDRSRDPRQLGHLTENELRLLQGHIVFYLVKCFSLQAASFPANSPDRLLAAASAQEQLKRLAPSDIPDPLWWESRLIEVACYRLKGDWNAADQGIARLESHATITSHRLDIRTARLQVAMDAERWDDLVNWIARGRDLDNETSPQLDLALLEAYLSLWQHENDSGNLAKRDEWRTLAMRLAQTIQSQYGSRWGRLALLLTAERIGTAGLPDDIQSSVRLAQELLAQGDWRRAVNTYRQAAELAKQQSLSSTAFQLAYQAATIVHEHGEVREAMTIFRTAAVENPNVPQASSGHWIAVRLAANVAREDASQQSQYEQLLHEHLRNWDTTPSANQARWWLARIHESKGEWRKAAELYLTGEHEEPAWTDAIQRGIHCWDIYLQKLPPTDDQLPRELRTAIAGFDAALERNSARDLPSELVHDYARLGKLHMIVHFAPDVDLNFLESFAIPQGAETTQHVDWARQSSFVLLLGWIRHNNVSKASEIWSTMRGDDHSEVLAWMERVAARHDFDSLPLAAEAVLALGAAWGTGDERWTTAQKQSWRVIRARSLALAGSLAQAIDAYRGLSQEQPNDPKIQVAFARLLLRSPEKNDITMALEHWRMLASRTKPGSDLWFESKWGIAKAHLEMGEPDRAVQIISVVTALHPELGGTARRQQFEELLRLCDAARSR